MLVLLYAWRRAFVLCAVWHIYVVCSGPACLFEYRVSISEFTV